MNHHQPVRPAVVVVVASDELQHGRREVVGKSGAICGGTEADLGVDGQRGHAAAGVVGTARERADLTHRAAGERDQVAGREPVVHVLGLGAVRRGRTR